MGAEPSVCDNDVGSTDADVTYAAGGAGAFNGMQDHKLVSRMAQASGRVPMPQTRAFAEEIQQNQQVTPDNRGQDQRECDNDCYNDQIKLKLKSKKEEESPLPPNGGQERDRDRNMFGDQEPDQVREADAGQGAKPTSPAPSVAPPVAVAPPAAPSPSSPRKSRKPALPIGEEALEALWSVFQTCYPQRRGNMDWSAARKNFIENIRMGREPDRLIKGAQCYHANMVEDGKVSAQGAKPLIRTEFVMMPSRFLNPQKDLWEEAITDFEQRELIRKSGGTVTRIGDNRRPSAQRPDPVPSRSSYRGPYA